MSDTQEKKIDTRNIYLVGVHGDKLCILRMPVGRLSKHQALNLAAYLVSMAEAIPGDEKFDEVLTAIQNT